MECRDLANISAKIIEFHWKANCFSDSDYKLIYRLGEYCRIVRWFDYGMLDILPDLVKLQEFQVPASLIIGSMLEEWELQKHIGLDTWHHYQKQIEMVAQLLGESSVPLVSTRINFEYPLLG